MKMRSRLLGIVALAAVSLAATHCRRAKRASAAAASENPLAAASPQAVASSSFVLIPAGEFIMGDTLDGDQNAPPHRVYVSEFYLQKTEVSKAEWDSVRTWAASHGYPDLAEGAGKAADHPVEVVSWWDTVKWCNARSEQEELNPCYTVDGAVMRSGTTEPSVNWTATGYRLPTEAEWEKAARGGLSGKRFPWGDTISHSQANFTNHGGETYQTGTSGIHPIAGAGSRPFTSPVGSFPANGYGLYDMAGNLWEWGWDLKGGDLTHPQTDPRGASSGTKRVIRGGAWDCYAEGTRCACRRHFEPGPAVGGIGFRPARSSVPKQ